MKSCTNQQENLKIFSETDGEGQQGMVNLFPSLGVR